MFGWMALKIMAVFLEIYNTYQLYFSDSVNSIFLIPRTVFLLFRQLYFSNSVNCIFLILSTVFL